MNPACPTCGSITSTHDWFKCKTEKEHAERIIKLLENILEEIRSKK